MTITQKHQILDETGQNHPLLEVDHACHGNSLEGLADKRHRYHLWVGSTGKLRTVVSNILEDPQQVILPQDMIPHLYYSGVPSHGNVMGKAQHNGARLLGQHQLLTASYVPSDRVLWPQLPQLQLSRVCL